jgi:hypothetical protein
VKDVWVGRVAGMAGHCRVGAVLARRTGRGPTVWWRLR